MSGSSNGFSGDGGGHNLACEDLVIVTQLASPKARVLQLFTAGSTLQIQEQESPQGQPLIVALFNDEVAGSIITPLIFKLLNCIRSGTFYIADVISNNGGQVKIRISARK
jgi:hypothetical protein